MNSLAGHLLVAPPHERDLDFIHTVILLIQHSEEQAVGVILNRPSDTPLRKVWRAKCRSSIRQLIAAARCPAQSWPCTPTRSSASLKSYRASTIPCKKRHLEQLIERPMDRLRFFTSHTGWGPGQLEQFVTDGPWLVRPATAEHVFCSGPGLWEEVSNPAASCHDWPMII